MKKESTPLSQKIGGIIDGYESYALQKLFGKGEPVLCVVSDDEKADRLKTALSLLKMPAEIFPAWDTLPYDRMSPSLNVMGRRLGILAKEEQTKNGILITTAAALLQKIPEVKKNGISLKTNVNIAQEDLVKELIEKGYERAFEVLKPGDFAVRGGLVDVFVVGMEEALRIDFFGDTIEQIKTFDPTSQLSTGTYKKEISLLPVSEVILTKETIESFRKNYRHEGGNVTDSIYLEITEGRKIMGMEQYLPYFYKKLETPLDLFEGRRIVTLESALGKLDEEDKRIKSFEEARKDSDYHPVPFKMFYESAKTVKKVLEKGIIFMPLKGMANSFDSKPFQFSTPDPFKELQAIIKNENVKIAAVTKGSKERITEVMRERTGVDVSDKIFIAENAFKKGFRAKDLTLVTEEDLFGERFVRGTHRKKKDTLTDLTSINIGDLLVHKLHGIGRYEGLETLTFQNEAHDCLKLVYEGGDKLFVPVENMDLLSRYSSDDSTASLDRLGGTAWQARVARLKKRLLEMAKELIEIEAKRQTKSAPVFLPPANYAEFTAHFPYQETDDQDEAIKDTLADLSSGKPMDRLICGDVGFGKTEVAMRAAFAVAANGGTVAMIVPTTLLARQHAETFKQRFKPFGIEVGNLSRFTKPSEKLAIKKGLKEGTLHVVIGTHALLSKEIEFANLSLLIIDEEQHFGVTLKEKLKRIKDSVHVLTLTATPIPRTLQMSLSGIRKMSVIMTPPISRLAVQAAVIPFDEVIVKETVERELLRHGQAFYVVPRIANLASKATLLKELIPAIRIQTVHGQMAPRQIEKIMADFLNQKFDILLSTTIVESGLDMPRVNTIIIDEADRYGLAQLYQLRGRVGRSSLKGFCCLTYPADKVLTETAQKRLLVMESLETLGAGFKLAEYDLDIRGAGNLLGDAQSGHIREVGVELYQKMLADAIAELVDEKTETLTFTPQINMGIPVFIPEEYISDLSLRLSMYRRIADIKSEEQLSKLKVELVDRFGNIPEETKNLLKLIELKNLCIKTGVEKLDVGEKGLILSFFGNTFKGADKLIAFMQQQVGTVRIRPDQKLVLFRMLKTKQDKFKAAKFLLDKLNEMVM